MNIEVLYVLVSWSGCDFFVISRDSNYLLDAKSVKLDADMPETDFWQSLEKYIDIHKSRGFSNVVIVYENALSTLVPIDFFDKVFASEYLNYNVSVASKEQVLYDTLESSGLVCVYTPFFKTGVYLSGFFEKTECRHYSSVLVSRLLSEACFSKHTIYVDMGDQHYRLIVIDSGKLRFYNTFSYLTKEDFLYFLLAALKHLKIDKNLANVIFIENKLLQDVGYFELVRAYLPFVSIKRLLVKNLSFSKKIRREDMVEYNTFLSCFF